MQIFDCQIVWKDNREVVNDYIAVGRCTERAKRVMDSSVFFFCETMEEFKNLFREDNGEDFFLLSYKAG